MDQMNLPERLKVLRNNNNYSQAYIAQKLNISRQTYSHYETGRITPPVDSLCALAEIYNISVDVLLMTDVHSTTFYNVNSNSSAPDYLFAKGYSDFLLENKSRFHSLDASEKRLLYYFSLLDSRDQKDILSFMKLKCINRKNENKPAE